MNVLPFPAAGGESAASSAGRGIGKIELAPGFALVEIPKSSVDTVIELADAKIPGQRVTARRQRSR